MKTKTIITFGVLATVGFIFGFSVSYYRDMKRYDRLEETRLEFMRRHDYKRDLLARLDTKVNPVLDKLHSLVEPTNPMELTARISKDSLNRLITDSFLQLLACDRAIYEMEELAIADSALFERTIEK